LVGLDTRHQRDLGTSKRAVDEGLLPTARGLNYFIAHPAERQPQIEARRGQVLDQRGRAGTVRSDAVGGRRTGLGREGDQRVGGQVVDLRQPPPNRPAGSFHEVHEWIVPARIEDDEAQTLGRLENLDYALEGDGLVLDVDIAFENGIHGKQIVGAVHLDAVASEEHDGNVRVAHLVRELAQRAAHDRRAEIAFDVDDVEVRRAKHLGDGAGIEAGVRQSADLLIGAIANDQRHALFGVRTKRHQEQQKAK
jgi:hypothetical protein